jgi:Flp pilus assembly protein protease CpaA
MDTNINLELVNLIFLIIILGIISSWFDIKKRKIPNSLLVLPIMFGFILNITTEIVSFQINYLINLLFAFFIGFLLWYINFWNAGDGKLFLTFVSLVPVELVFRNKINLYSYDIIFYTFVPVFFVFLIFLLTQTRKEEFFYALKQSFKPKIIFNIFIAFFSFQWIIQLININFGLKLNFFFSALILFFVFDALEKILRLKLINLFYVIFVLRIFIDGNNIFSINFIIHFLYQISIFLVFVYFFIYIAYFKFGVHVKISDLKIGMNLCEKIIKKKEKYSVIPDIKISLFMFLHDKVKQEAVIDIKPEGLTKEEIRKIQTWNKIGKIEVGSLLIQKRIPYAPFQFLGVLIIIFANIIVF